VGEHTIQFRKEATRWLGIWPDSSLKLTTHCQKCIKRARAAERRLRSLVGKFGTPPATARTLQTAIIQSTMLYGAELPWDGKKTHAQQYQLGINRMARSALGVLPSTPLGALINESAPTPAEHLLDYRQARFAQRVLSAPEGSGTEDIIRRRGTALAERLRTATHLGEGDDDVEAGHGEEGKKFQGAVVIIEGKNPKETEEMAKAAALEWKIRGTRPGRTDPGRRTKKWDAQWCGRKKQGTAQHRGLSKKGRQEYGPDGKENGGWKTTSYHPHQSGGREGGTWDKRFGDKATTSSRRPNTTDGPGRDTISGQTKRCSTPNYMPSTGQPCGSENGANTTKNTLYLSTRRQR